MTEKKKHYWRKKILWAFLLLFVIANIAILATGKIYLYKALFYNYADIDDQDIFDSRKVQNGTPAEWPLSHDYNKAKLPDATLKELEKNGTVEFLVIKDDSIRYEQYWDHYDRHSISNSFSMSKS